MEGKSGNTRVHEMPFYTYLKLDGNNPNLGWLLLTPSDQIGIIGSGNQEVWALGAQFLQNYMSIYDFANKKVGFVESVSAAIKLDPADLRSQLGKEI